MPRRKSSRISSSPYARPVTPGNSQIPPVTNNDVAIQEHGPPLSISTSPNEPADAASNQDNTSPIPIAATQQGPVIIPRLPITDHSSLSGEEGNLYPVPLSLAHGQIPLAIKDPISDLDLWALGYSPVKVNTLKLLLVNYPLLNDAKILLDGFSHGFRLRYEGPRIQVLSKNLHSAHQYPNELQNIIDSEIEKGRVAGPFLASPISNLRISPIGVVPKKSGGWQLITHLSSPKGFSVNNFISQEFSTVNYSSFDNALKIIQQVGRGALLGKKDIKSAFRLLPIHPADFCLLGFKHAGKFYFDKCLPFGCSVSCSLFEKFSTFIHWVTSKNAGLNSLDHYLDDFIFIGAHDSDNCNKLMLSFDNVCESLGVPVAHEKTEGPSNKLTYLGLDIYTVNLTISVPPSKISELKVLLHDLSQRRKVTLKHMQSVAGSLAFCCKVLPPGRAFLRRFYASMSKIKEPHHFIRITQSMKEDIKIWLIFLDQFNGTYHFPDIDWSDSDILQLYTDSSSIACGAFYTGSWFVLPWPSHWPQEILQDMSYLELIPILIAIIAWSATLNNKKLLIHTDNAALVPIINTKSSKSERIMSLLRPLVLETLYYNIQVKARHIPGHFNKIADSLSRLQFQKFRRLAPTAAASPTQIPTKIWTILPQ